MSNTLPNYRCSHPNCTKEYTSKYNLQRHFESNHFKIRRFRCRVCGKSLSSKQNLQEHSYTHSQIKPYVCNYPNCAKSFRQSSQLSNHKKLHQEILNFCRKQNEFICLKIESRRLELALIETKNFQDELVRIKNIGEEKIFLPELSGPQISVTLPGLLSALN